MELRVLNYFLAVAREENFTKAAMTLHVTQPTLSRQIAQLEEELGVKLFTRSSHKIILTDEGIILKRRAQEILSLADKAKRDFIKSGENLEGVISIGSGEFLSTKYLTDCITEFSAIHPNVKFEIQSGNGDFVDENIGKGLLDIGLVLEDFDRDKYDFIEMPIKEQWGVLVDEKSDLAEYDSVTAKDLSGREFITSMGEFAQSIIGRQLGKYSQTVKIKASGNLLYNEAMLVKSGFGSVFTIRLESKYSGLRFVPFSPPLKTATALVFKKYQTFSPAVSAFVEFSKKYFSRIE